MAKNEMGGTVGSFKFAVNHALRKFKEHNCYVDGDESATDRAGTAPATPNAKKGGAKKRKAAETENDEDEEEMEMPPKKARGGKKDAIKMEDDDCV